MHIFSETITLQCDAAPTVPAPFDDLPGFDSMLARLSARLIALRPAEVDAAIAAAFGSIVEALDVDRCALLRLDPDGRSFTRVSIFTRDGMRTAPLHERVFGYPWCIEKINRGQAVIFSTADELPPEAHVDKESFKKAGSQSMASIPLVVAGEIYGTLNFLCLDRRREWSEELLSRVRLVAEILGNTIARKHVQEENQRLLAFEQMLVEVAASLISLAAGDVDSAVSNGLRRMAEFLHAERATLWAFDRGSDDLLPGHSWRSANAPEPARVQGRDLPSFSARLKSGSVVRIDGMDEASAAVDAHDRDTLRALGSVSLLALPLKVSGAVVGAISLDTVQTRRAWPEALEPRVRLLGEVFATALARQQAERSMREAQAEAAQHRERLAHIARLHTVGEMSAGITHEVSQPLVAIENYALAARRHAAAGPAANNAKVCELLDKIAAQSSRAGTVMRKLRTMVKRHELEMKKVRIDQIVDESLRFARMEGHLNDVAVTLRVAPGLPDVIADDIQIQQVIVNLVRNASDAMNAAASPGASKDLIIEVGTLKEAQVFVRIEDTGAGFGEGALERIFEAFFTTKTAGLGIGLSLCRAIVEAHGGQVNGRARPGGGAIFEFTLPIAEENDK
ncbi:GAF domain-containing protein [Variovorax sp. J22R133]|uniref:GAF domain-containing protein n=1 Tax=Variovorax brevis TaxID=3053503 RepID=UPI00257588BA|nr:GAF domain-containing protein [Variovorax sp. J22R133]MDM0112278.1 GAF domain-containing protein [Variovorax sp. J22R133]